MSLVFYSHPISLPLCFFMGYPVPLSFPFLLFSPLPAYLSTYIILFLSSLLSPLFIHTYWGIPLFHLLLLYAFHIQFLVSSFNFPVYSFSTSSFCILLSAYRRFFPSCVYHVFIHKSFCFCTDSKRILLSFPEFLYCHYHSLSVLTFHPFVSLILYWLTLLNSFSPYPIIPHLSFSSVIPYRHLHFLIYSFLLIISLFRIVLTPDKLLRVWTLFLHPLP